MDRMELSCKVCQHVWKGLIEPKRCPSPKCRSLRWKDGEDGRVAITLFAIRVPFEEGEKFRRAAKAAGYEKVHEWLLGIARKAIAPPSPQASASRFYRDIQIDGKTGEPVDVTGRNPLPVAEKTSNINSSMIAAKDSWRPKIQRWAAQYDGDPGAVGEELMTALKGEIPPGRFQRWHSDVKTREKFIAWLDGEHPIEG